MAKQGISHKKKTGSSPPSKPLPTTGGSSRSCSSTTTPEKVHLRARQILRFGNARHARPRPDGNNNSSSSSSPARAKLMPYDLQLARVVVKSARRAGGSSSETNDDDDNDDLENEERWPAKWDEAQGAKSITMHLLHWRQACADAGFRATMDDSVGGVGDEDKDEHGDEHGDEHVDDHVDDHVDEHVDGHVDEHVDEHGDVDGAGAGAEDKDESRLSGHQQPMMAARLEEPQPLVDSSPDLRTIFITADLLAWSVLPACLVMCAISWALARWVAP